MSSPRRASTESISRSAQLRYAREIIELEGRALAHLAERLDHEFCRAVDALFHCRGSVIASGMGKAGLIAQKIAATLASTGTRSHWLHPADAVHGDLGRIRSDDVVLLFSQSGETEEVVRLLPLRGARARWGVRPRSSSSWVRCKRPANTDLPPVPAPPRCSPAATLSLW
jgi:DNA-binding MurR/RpiR family transcriptional regulator